jgi:TldD protein
VIGLCLVGLVGVALAADAEAADPLRAALHQELERSLTDLALPGEPPPYWVSYDVTQGQVATVYAESGAVLTEDLGPHRRLRVEVRCGDADFDSGNFDALGEPNGVIVAGLPLEDDVLALRREIWLHTDQAYKDAVEQLSRKSAELTVEDLPGPTQAPLEPPWTGDVQPLEVDAERIGSLVTHLSGLLADDPLLEEIVAAGRDWQGTRVTVTSEGTSIERQTGHAVLRIEAVLRTADGSRVRNGRWWVARTAGELPPVAELEAEVRDLQAWLHAMGDAPVLNDWLGPVLFEGPAAVEAFRQLVAPEIVGTPPVREGRGPWGAEPIERPRARVGRRLLPEGWTVVDDPGLALPGQLGLDHEGVVAQRVVLVEDGVVQRLLQSRVPWGESPESTGHARASGGDRREAVSTNVSIVPPEGLSVRKLEKAALHLARQTGQDRVLVVRRLEPPSMTEDFDVHFTGEGPPPGLTPPYEAYLLYADGRREAVRGLGFHGVDRRMLRDVVAAGEPGEWQGVMDAVPGPQRYLIGSVGGMPAAWSGPSILVSELELYGSGGGEPRVLPAPPVASAEQAAP